MGNKPFTMIAVVIFALMALIHAYRLVTHFQIILGSHTVPEWVSIVGMVVAGGLALMVYRENR
ncbi:MAG: hypothetical protein ACJ8C8_19840 [Microvirga sp.]